MEVAWEEEDVGGRGTLRESSRVLHSSKREEKEINGRSKRCQETKSVPQEFLERGETNFGTVEDISPAYGYAQAHKPRRTVTHGYAKSGSGRGPRQTKRNDWNHKRERAQTTTTRKQPDANKCQAEK